VSSAPATPWTLAPGDTIRRDALHQTYGGRTQGGMTTSTTSPNIFLFTDPALGHKYGYYDGWVGPHFHYTGMGRYGDQQMRDINLSLSRHDALGVSVRLFRKASGLVTYLGEFALDGAHPVYQMDAPQMGTTELRQVLVFKLVPVGPVIRDAQDDRQLPTGISGLAIDAALEGGEPVIRVIPVEEQHVTGSTVTPAGTPYVVTRREQLLVRKYKAYLEARGSAVDRLEVVPTGEANAIRNDIYDTTRENLVEAKGSGSRAAVRMALAQVLDYGRFKPGAVRAVLLPTRPRPDLEQFLQTYGVHAVWPQGAGFADNCDGRLS
jgi:hypothetical protein